MQIDFSSAAPVPSAAITFLVEKDGLARLATGLIDAAALDLVKAAARASRFDGETASLVETFIAEAGGARRILLIGTGAGGGKRLRTCRRRVDRAPADLGRRKRQRRFRERWCHAESRRTLCRCGCAARLAS